MIEREVTCCQCGKRVTMYPWRPAESYVCSFRCLEVEYGERPA